MTKKQGLTATIYSINVAVEHNTDGSITICKELVDEILADRKTTKFVRRILVCGQSRNRYGPPLKIHKAE